ncbi:MAG: TraR/DksA C4-type zinc finger protein [Candidatus Shapirobacteria bacterium]|nr:TraR/DksA C4-type zinc finger protein [Candidatus Shapirobacteria bacterium]
MIKNKDMKIVSFPSRLLLPIKTFLESEIVKLKRTKKNINEADPFKDESRTTNNSLEEDVDEQVGHFDAEVKANFVSVQIVQFRKALTRMKLGKYGICENCGKMIDTDRLAVRPETTVCIDCEKERED